MNNVQLSHIYGRTVLETQVCPKCGSRSFVINGKISCCGAPAESLESNGFKVEVDKTNSRRKRPKKWLREQTLEKQGHRCFYCRDQFDTYRRIDGQYRKVLIAWDHLVPFSYDGNNHEFVAACRECNGMKSSLMFSSIDEARRVLSLKIHEKKTAIPRTPVRKLL